MKKLIIALALMLPLMVSCFKTEIDFKKGEPLAAYVAGQKTTQTLVIGINSVFTFGFDVVGGTSNEHIVTSADPSIVEVFYQRAGMAHFDGLNTVAYAQVFLTPKKLGSTVITVTDKESGENFKLVVEVRKSNYVFPITKSESSDFPESAYLWFTKEKDNAKMYILSEDKHPYAVWDYKFVDITSDYRTNGMYLDITKYAGLMGAPVDESERVQKRWKVMFDEGARIVSASDAINQLFSDYGVIETKADEEYHYILVDPEDDKVTVTLGLPMEDYLDL